MSLPFRAFLSRLFSSYLCFVLQPFSFGGLYGTKSKYGDMDITGDGAMEFFTNRIKVTSKWPLSKPPSSRKRAHGDMSSASVQPLDSANFAGQM
jgi:malonate-semialdehyde dehydrogenase (acetylating) / methylmalonate-semialdehyde dehydrogenase